MNTRTNILERIGLTRDEAAMYKALIEISPASISDVVRKAKMHRPTVYKALPNLIEKGLVSVMPKGKQKKYVAESPDKLEKIFQNIEDDFNSEIYNLREVYDSQGRKPIITFTEGDKAIKDLFSDVVHSLNKNDVYYRYSSGLTLARRKYVPADYRAVRDRKSLERLIITDETSKKMSSNRLGKTMKTIPEDSNLFDLNVTQIIYGKKVALIDYNTKTVITIENEMIARFQKKLFKLLYGRL